MRNWLKRHYKTIIRCTYLIPILFAAGVSIAHVISWYEISNPISWAVYLSVGVEIAALSALAGITTKINKWVYVPFGIVTLIQFIGNIFFSFQYIDTASESFNSWVLLTEPIFRDWLIEPNDILGHRRLLAILAGGCIPLISLSFLHLLISFNDKVENERVIDDNSEPEIKEQPIQISEQEKKK